MKRLLIALHLILPFQAQALQPKTYSTRREREYLCSAWKAAALIACLLGATRRFPSPNLVLWE